MKKKQVSCLLVTRRGKLLGIITESDFAQVAAELLQELEDSCD